MAEASGFLETYDDEGRGKERQLSINRNYPTSPFNSNRPTWVPVGIP
jgi:hypothetical protein